MQQLIAFTPAGREAAEWCCPTAQNTGVELRCPGRPRRSSPSSRPAAGSAGPGRLAEADIGGGSLEMAFGFDEMPEVARSPPSRRGAADQGVFPEDPSAEAAVRALRRHARGDRQGGGDLRDLWPLDRVCASSRPSSSWPGWRVRRRAPRGSTSRAGCSAPTCRSGSANFARMPAAERATLPRGLGRPGQAVAGRARGRGGDRPVRGGGRGHLPVGVAGRNCPVRRLDACRRRI